jgi:ATP-binding protein involved in chromosome partitioning
MELEMRIAIPLTGGQLSHHFGHCEQFLFVDTDTGQRRVLAKNNETGPDHVPGLLPKRLIERGVDTVIAAGVGARARALLSASSVKVLSGVAATDPDALIGDLLDGKLEMGSNLCDRSGRGCGH